MSAFVVLTIFLTCHICKQATWETLPVALLTGINLYNAWGDFLDEWVVKAGTDEYLGADVAVRSGFVTDLGMFHWFFLQVTAGGSWRTARAVELREPSFLGLDHTCSTGFVVDTTVWRCLRQNVVCDTRCFDLNQTTLPKRQRHFACPVPPPAPTERAFP